MLAFIRKIPVFRWLLWWMAGMLLPLKSLHFFAAVSLAGVWLLLIFPILEKRLSTAWSLRWIPGLALACFWFSCGGFASFFLEKKAAAPPVSGAFTVVGRIQTVPELKKDKMRFILDLTKTEPGYESWAGKLLQINLPADIRAKQLEIGDLLLINLFPGMPQRSGNPYAFDYASWFRKQGVCAVSSVLSENWRVYRKASRYAIRTQAERCRRLLVNRLAEAGMKGEELALASALLLGNTQELTGETKVVFSQAGISHILSVSGLHVAVIYGILSFLLSFTDRFHWLRVPRQLLLIVLLVLYAFLTGLSPSVLRSVFMFSLLILGKTLNRRSQSLNTVLLSALILLLIHPAYLYDLGFGLSYIAVVFLVAVYPPVVARWSPSNPLLDKVWKALCLSLVAQLGTAPLTIAVFHSFPNYFLLNNALAVPFSSLLLILGAATLLFGLVPLAGAWLTMLTNGFYGFFLNFAAWSARLPFSTTVGLELNSFQVILLYLLMASLFACFIMRRRRAFRPVLLVLLCLQFLALFDNFKI